MSLPLLVAGAILLIWLGLGQEVARGNRRLRRLAALPLTAPATWPRGSLVVAARNEANHIAAAVATMLALDYPDFEVIAVDDRSEDATGAVLDQLAAREPRLRVVHI